MTTTTSFFLPLFLTLLLPCCHSTASGDSSKTPSPQNVSPMVVKNVVTPKEISFFPRKSPPFFFHYFYRFPRYHFPAYRHPHYLHPSPPPSVPMAQTPETSDSSPPPNSAPADPKLSQPKPPTVPRWGRQWPSLVPPVSPIGNTGKQGTLPGGAPPSPLKSGVPVAAGRIPHWPRPRSFPRWQNPRSATLPILPPKISNWLHPKFCPKWSRPKLFVGHPYLLHPRPFQSLPVPGSSDAYPFSLPVRSHWPAHISNRPPMQNKPPVPGSSDAYPFRLPVRSHWPAHISNLPPMQNKPPLQHP